ncbi:MAG: hypothetical protein J0I47_10695 [Sphingomonas sp.]|uniref:hypothetical protein n=1 Tax=Sphingomonas sp. TaxID=28214 RepID=UPI001AD3C5AA|nr:hypothetical protein [Sphingomonas sp.]MBN8808682.1 hypothetical protein [Sphingomonas sp.]
MTSDQQVAAGVAVAAAVLAIAAGMIDWRQKKRRNLDRVSLLDWRTVQLVALVATIVAAAFALH